MKRLVTFIMLAISSNSFAWENTATHMDLSDEAARRSVIDSKLLEQYYSYNGSTRKLRFWLQEGAKLEDSGSIFAPNTARYRNHFHNPLINLTPPLEMLTQGGLTDKMDGQSALFWAQDGQNQTGFVDGDWSWQTVRNHYYRSLTESDKSLIDEFTVKTYLGLGYQMHLLQDMGQPDHVRNDAHPIDGSGFLRGLETWARKKRSLIRQYAATATKPMVDLTQPVFNDFASFAPVGRLMDTRRYAADWTPSASMSQGLAEYTNANFFSDDTVFAARYATDDKHYFPSPRKEGTDIQAYFDGTKAPETFISEDGKSVKGLWISKTGEGETVPHLVRVGAAADLAYSVFGEGKLFYAALGRDEITYDDYARLLVPRAVGYSAALLDYFFRGKIDVQPVHGGVTFRTITITARNITANGEEMPAGEVSLVIRYKELQESGFGPMRTLNFPADEYRYRVVTLPGLIKIPSANDPEPTVQLTFDLSTDPLPLHLADVTLQLVYKGKLGNEESAVAVGSKALDALNTDIAISLPSSGIYAKTMGSNFDSLALTAVTNIPGGLALADGVIELVLEYQVATTDPFASLPVDSEPLDAESYIIRLAERNGVNMLPQGVPVELQFDLSAAPLPLWATDVYLNVVYRRSGDPETKSLAVGYHDISEPTPMDLFNDTDYVCISSQWYPAGSSEALAAADLAGNRNSIDDDTDTYRHDFTDINAKASATDNPVRASASTFDFLEPGPVIPNSLLRMGYVLADYSFRYSFLPNWVHTDPMDGWIRTEGATLDTGTAVRNQTDLDEVYRYPGMYGMRGKLMWGGAGIVYDNAKFPDGSSCPWDVLP